MISTRPGCKTTPERAVEKATRSQGASRPPDLPTPDLSKLPKPPDLPDLPDLPNLPPRVELIRGTDDELAESSLRRMRIGRPCYMNRYKTGRRTGQTTQTTLSFPRCPHLIQAHAKIREVSNPSTPITSWRLSPRRRTTSLPRSSSSSASRHSPISSATFRSTTPPHSTFQTRTPGRTSICATRSTT